MSDHETTLRNAVAELDEWLSTNKRTPNDSQVGMRAACLAGADALRLLPLAMAGDLCRGGDCQHPDCVSVRALLAPTEPTR